MRHEVDYARQLFAQGLPLIAMVDRGLALDLDLFSRGDLEILDAIERRQYDVLSRRPAISKATKLGCWHRRSGATWAEGGQCERGGSSGVRGLPGDRTGRGEEKIFTTPSSHCRRASETRFARYTPLCAGRMILPTMEPLPSRTAALRWTAGWVVGARRSTERTRATRFSLRCGTRVAVSRSRAVARSVGARNGLGHRAEGRHLSYLR